MKLCIGTRSSALALWQAHHIRDRLLAECPGVEEVEFLIIKTRGDKILDRMLSKVGGKGLFVTEIEDAVLDGRVDLAVHSMKDMPALVPDELEFAAIPRRASPFDAFVAPIGCGTSCLGDLPKGSVVGTSSLRRSCQLLALRPDLDIRPLRGNVDTRLRKLDEGVDGMAAIVLAAAGLARLGLGARVTAQFDERTMIPAVGQGALAIESRRDRRDVAAVLATLNDPATALAIEAERAFLRRVEGSCQVPVGAYAKVDGDQLKIRAFVGSPDGLLFVAAQASGSIEDPEPLGDSVAADILANGGRAILSDLLG